MSRLVLAVLLFVVGGWRPASAIEKTLGPVNVELRLSAGSQVGGFETPVTGRVDADAAFTWSTVLDIERVTNGGSVFGVHLEVDDGGRTVESLNRDELYLYYANELGRFEIGEQDGAADVLTLRAPILGLGQIRGDFARYAGTAALLSPLDTVDAPKFVYISSPFAGLRFGASYAPKYEVNREDPLPRNRTLQRNGIELGLQYQLPVGSWVLGASGTHVRASADPITGRADIDSSSIGLQARHGRFVIGGAWVDRGDSNRLGPTNQDEINFGISWRGPLWGVAASTAIGRSDPVDSRLVALGGFWNFSRYFVLRSDLVHYDERRSAAAPLLPAPPAQAGLVAVVEIGFEF
jgi:hypothetical protein